MNAWIPGRSCPLAYRYDARSFARSPDLHADTLYIAGGVYGNEQALDAITEMHATEPGAALIFNGDFNWFNIERAAFAGINTRVLRHPALRGNVETELATADDVAGCGCGYPEWVPDAEVERSNAIMQRLRPIARDEPAICDRLAALPTHLVAQVRGIRVAIVHGDLESLAGWEIAQEHADDPQRCAQIAQQMARAEVRIVASSHTCLPVAFELVIAGRNGAVINNGAAGMPNFRGSRCGVITRISVRPVTGEAPLYTLRVEDLYVEALAVRYDHDRFVRSFERLWTPDSPAYLSYHQRIVAGPNYAMAQALRRCAHSLSSTVGGLA